MNPPDARIDKETAACCLTLLSLSNCCNGGRQQHETSLSGWNLGSSLPPNGGFVQEKAQQGDKALQVDDLVTKDFAKLSLEERQNITEEVDGAEKGLVEEEHSFVEKCLALLEEELGKIVGKSRVAYDRAMALNAEYVQNRKFRIMFLRCDEFVAQKAAIRMIKHFELKLELFGEEKLVKKITFDDLRKDDQAALLTGSHQLLGKDTKGRSTAFIFPPLLDYRTWENCVCACINVFRCLLCA